MKRKFATNLILLLSLNLLVKPIWIFGIDRTVQNMVGAGEYGLFFALFNFSILLNITLDFGLTNFNNREISQNPQMLPRYLSNMVGIKFFMAILFMVVCFGAAFMLGYSDRQLWLLLFLAINQFLSSFILYLRSNISGLHLFRTDSLLSVTDRVLMIILCSVLLWTPLRQSFSIEWFVYAQSLAYGLTALIALMVVAGKVDSFSPRFSLTFLASIAKQSYPYALLVLLMSFHYRVDSVMLERLLPDGQIQAGIYAQAFRLLDASVMVPFLFSTLLLPIFSRMLRLGESVNQLLRFSLSLLMVFAIAFATACIVHRQPIMELLYVGKTMESASIFAILMACFVFSSMSYVLGTLLTANGSLTHLNAIALIGVIVNIVFNFIFIPKYGALGAAVVSLITHLIIAILQGLVTLRTFTLKIPWAAVGRLFAFLGVFALLALTLAWLPLHWALSAALIAVAGVGVASVFNFFRVKELVAAVLDFDH